MEKMTDKTERMDDKQHIELKIEYSEALKEINLVLQKYKKLEEIHQETLSRLNMAQNQYDKINEKYV